MFRKLIAITITFAMFSVSAGASTQNGLKAAIDELNYSLNVEWDQSDKAFYADQMEKFSGRIAEMRAQGLTNKEMLDFVKSQVKDAKAARDIGASFNTVSVNKMSAQEASDYLMKTFKKSYNTGASWDGGIVASYAISALVIIGIVVYVMTADGGSSRGGAEVSNGSGNVCSPQYICQYENIYVLGGAGAGGYTYQQVCFWTQCY